MGSAAPAAGGWGWAVSVQQAPWAGVRTSKVWAGGRGGVGRGGSAGWLAGAACALGQARDNITKSNTVPTDGWRQKEGNQALPLKVS